MCVRTVELIGLLADLYAQRVACVRR